MTTRFFHFLAVVAICAQVAYAYTSVDEAPRCSVAEFTLHCAQGFFAPEAYGAELAWWADDAREGREPGTAGSIQSAERAAETFKRLGLLPAGDTIDGTRSYFQFFEDGGKLGLLPGHRLAVGAHEFEWGKEWSLLGGVSEVALDNLQVMFAGYGITAPEHGYDDYAGLDVKGKAVLILRHEPQETTTDSVWNGASPTDHAHFPNKRKNAQDHGAAAVLCVDGPLHHDPANDPLCSLMTHTGDGAVPVLHVRASVAAALLEGTGPDLLALQTAIDASGKPASRALGCAMVAIKAKTGIVAKARNVVALLEGADPALKEEALVIGAHYDHVGRGDYGSPVPNGGAVHNGADDNASGAVGVLEVAGAFVRAGLRPSRSIVFALFDAEEKGLCGSRYYTDHPALPLAKTVAMLNLDMIAFTPRGECLAVGADTSDAWKTILARAGRDTTLKLSPAPGRKDGGSDHASFIARKIPAIFFFTGMHPNYHTPNDDASTCDPKIAVEVLKVVCATAFLCTQKTDGLAFKEETPPVLGVAIEPQGEDTLRVRAITPGSGAEKAALAIDDILLSVNGAPVKKFADLRAILRERAPGDTVKVRYRRGAEEREVDVVLGQ
jgi:hypothetical protein